MATTKIRGQRRRPLLQQARDVAVEQPRRPGSRPAASRASRRGRPPASRTPRPRTGRRTAGTAGRARSTACSAGRVGPGRRCADERARPFHALHRRGATGGGAARRRVLRHDLARAQDRRGPRPARPRTLPTPKPMIDEADHLGADRQRRGDDDELGRLAAEQADRAGDRRSRPSRAGRPRSRSARCPRRRAASWPRPAWRATPCSSGVISWPSSPAARRPSRDSLPAPPSVKYPMAANRLMTATMIRMTPAATRIACSPRVPTVASAPRLTIQGERGLGQRQCRRARSPRKAEFRPAPARPELRLATGSEARCRPAACDRRGSRQPRRHRISVSRGRSAASRRPRGSVMKPSKSEPSATQSSPPTRGDVLDVVGDALQRAEQCRPDTPRRR